MLSLFFLICHPSCLFDAVPVLSPCFAFSLLQLGAVEERSPCTTVACPAGEEASCTDASPRLPPVHDDGDQPEGRQGLGNVIGFVRL